MLRAAGMAVHETGTDHGTVTAVVDGRPVETTTYRVEGRYSDRRHPDECALCHGTCARTWRAATSP